MSCYIVGQTHVNAMLTCAIRVPQDVFLYDPFDNKQKIMPRIDQGDKKVIFRKHELLLLGNIGRSFMAMNMRSYVERYAPAKEERERLQVSVDLYRFYDLGPEILQDHKKHLTSNPWIGHCLTACYSYQSCEKRGWHRTVGGTNTLLLKEYFYDSILKRHNVDRHKPDLWHYDAL